MRKLRHRVVKQHAWFELMIEGRPSAARVCTSDYYFILPLVLGFLQKDVRAIEEKEENKVIHNLSRVGFTYRFRLYYTVFPSCCPS